MPGPTTEVLNDDLKGLRSDLHEVEVRLSSTLARLSAEFGLFKWLLGLTLAASLGGVGSGIWWAGGLTNRVATLEARAEKVDGRLGAIEDRLSRVENRLTAMDGHLGEIDRRLTAIETALVRILDRLPPKP